MANLVSSIDPLKASLENLLVITFAKARSPNYHLAIKVAQTCSGYAEFDIENSKVHFIAICPNPDDVSRALLILQYTSGWSTSQVFCKGQLLKNTYNLTSILECYLESAKCDDYKAYCFGVIDDPSLKRPRTTNFTIKIAVNDEAPEKPIDRYIIPCKFLGHYGTNLIPDHPSSFRNQIQAQAVQKGCNICPRFNADNFQKSEKNTLMNS